MVPKMIYFLVICCEVHYHEGVLIFLTPADLYLLEDTLHTLTNKTLPYKQINLFFKYVYTTEREVFVSNNR